MTDPAPSDSTHRHPEIEHFLNLNTILHSLVDFIRPETYIAQEELEAYNELKEKFLREPNSKRAQPSGKTQGPTKKSPLEVAGVQSIRSTSGIYQFLAHHHKDNSAAAMNKKKGAASVSRDELLKKLHAKMPHRQQQAENGVDPSAKRKRTKEVSKEPAKKLRITTKEWTATPTASKTSVEKPTVAVTPQLTFGRFDFNNGDEPIVKGSKKKKTMKKFENKETKLKNTLRKIETEEQEIKRLRTEDPDQSKELVRSKHWQTALAKAKGEKVRDNVQLLRKTIKKEQQRRTRSAKKWQDNKSQTDKRMKERQDKRQTNIQKRKDDKKAKIKKKLIKKGRLVS